MVVVALEAFQLNRKSGWGLADEKLLCRSTAVGMSRLTMVAFDQVMAFDQSFGHEEGVQDPGDIVRSLFCFEDEAYMGGESKRLLNGNVASLVSQLGFYIARSTRVWAGCCTLLWENVNPYHQRGLDAECRVINPSDSFAHVAGH